MLNALLMHYDELSKQQGIAFSADIRKASVEQLNWVDLTTMLGNLLENAVESASGSENAFVDVVLDCREPSNALILSIENSCSAAPNYSSYGTLISSKKTTAPHGIGLQSVKRVVEKYGGDIHGSYDSGTNIYHTVVVIPND